MTWTLRSDLAEAGSTPDWAEVAKGPRRRPLAIYDAALLGIGSGYPCTPRRSLASECNDRHCWSRLRCRRLFPGPLWRLLVVCSSGCEGWQLPWAAWRAPPARRLLTPALVLPADYDPANSCLVAAAPARLLPHRLRPRRCPPPPPRANVSCNAHAIGLSRVFPNRPSRRGAFASRTANATHTAITTPT
jgi:hypothetical protein